MSTKWDGEDGASLIQQRKHTLEARSNQKTFVVSLRFSTKIFIRHPRTLYATEDAYERCKHELGERKSTVCSFSVITSRTVI